MPENDETLTAAQLSREKQIPEKTLAQWRYLGKGPRYLKLVGHVRYRRSDVEEWLASCERTGSDAA